jgi:hypothetical protein
MTMFLPIPSCDRTEILFQQTYDDALWLIHTIGSTDKSNPPTGQFDNDRFQFHILPHYKMGEQAHKFMTMPHATPHIILFDMQSTFLDNNLNNEHGDLCKTALKVATHEIMDNDPLNHYQNGKTPFYAIASLGYDLTRHAIDAHYTLHEFYENIDILIGQSYHVQELIARQKFIPR